MGLNDSKQKAIVRTIIPKVTTIDEVGDSKFRLIEQVVEGVD